MATQFKEFMSEKRLIARSCIVIVWLVGVFCGAILMLLFAMLGVLS